MSVFETLLTELHIKKKKNHETAADILAAVKAGRKEIDALEEAKTEQEQLREQAAKSFDLTAKKLAEAEIVSLRNKINSMQGDIDVLSDALTLKRTAEISAAAKEGLARADKLREIATALQAKKYLELATGIALIVGLERYADEESEAAVDKARAAGNNKVVFKRVRNNFGRSQTDKPLYMQVVLGNPLNSHMALSNPGKQWDGSGRFLDALKEVKLDIAGIADRLMNAKDPVAELESILKAETLLPNEAITAPPPPKPTTREIVHSHQSYAGHNRIWDPAAESRSGNGRWLSEEEAAARGLIDGSSQMNTP